MSILINRDTVNYDRFYRKTGTHSFNPECGTNFVGVTPERWNDSRDFCF